MELQFVVIPIRIRLTRLMRLQSLRFLQHAGSWPLALWDWSCYFENRRLFLKLELSIDFFCDDSEHFDFIDNIEHCVFFVVDVALHRCRLLENHPRLSLIHLSSADAEHSLLQAILIRFVVAQRAMR